MIVYTWNGLSISIFVSQNNNIEKVWLVPLLFNFFLIDRFLLINLFGSVGGIAICNRFDDSDPVELISFLLSHYAILEHLSSSVSMLYNISKRETPLFLWTQKRKRTSAISRITGRSTMIKKTQGKCLTTISL